MTAATFTATSHGATEPRSARNSLLRVFVPSWRALAIAAAVLLSACGGDDTPTTPSNPPGRMTENWSSVVAPGGASTRSFTVSSAGTIAVTLTGAGATVGLGVGLPRVSGGGCRLGVTVNGTPGGSPQITTQADAGQYCVQVYDLGTLTDPVAFALKIEHP